MSTSTPSTTLLRGAYDLHVHCTPDVIPRAQDLVTLAQEAQGAGMAGVLLKDHTASTVGRAYVLNHLYAGGPRFFSALVLNPPVGGLNPHAVEAVLRSGADMIYFPTYAAKHQLDVMGRKGFSPAYPLPRGAFRGLTVLDRRGCIKPEVKAILKLIAAHDAVLATGHLAPQESLALLELAQETGVRRMVVTHASGAVTAMSIAQQEEAIARGAFIEHCFVAVTAAYPAHVPLEAIRDQIRQVGVQHAIVSSDLGQVANGPVVAGFARYLDALRGLGFSEDEMRAMIVENPRRLLTERTDQPPR